MLLSSRFDKESCVLVYNGVLSWTTKGVEELLVCHMSFSLFSSLSSRCGDGCFLCKSSEVFGTLVLVILVLSLVQSLDLVHLDRVVLEGVVCWAGVLSSIAICWRIFETSLRLTLSPCRALSLGLCDLDRGFIVTRS